MFEATGVPDTISQGIKMLKPLGKLISIGIHLSSVKLDMTTFNRNDLTIIGIHEGEIPWERALSPVEVNTDKLQKLITHRFSFDEEEKAFNFAINKKGTKIIFV